MARRGECSARVGWLVVALLATAFGCTPLAVDPEAGGTEPTATRRSALVGFEPGTAITPAGFVALGLAPQAVRLGSRGVFQADLALANGGVNVGSAAIATAPWRVGGSFGIEPQARVTGDLTIGGTLALGAQATVVGTVVEHASVPRLAFPSSTGLLGQLGVSFGTGTKPDIFIGPGGTQTLAAGGQRVANLTLQQGATLIVSSVSALEVTGSVNLGPQARISVRNGGRLVLFARQTVETSTDAVIEQSGQALGRGLIVALGSGATMHWGTNARFGPGLVYGVEPPGSTRKTTLADIVRATGSLVASEAYTSPTSQINLTSRFLGCVGGLSPVTVAITSPLDRQDREVPRGTTTVPVAGTVSNAAGLDALTIEDAGPAHAVTVAANGSFTGTAALRSDGEPTNICVVARDCQDRVTRTCVIVGVRHDIEILFTSPRPGDRVSVPAINITGRIIGPRPTRIAAGSIQGGMLQDAFTIPAVPLAVGTNVIVVEAQAPSGDVTRRRLMVIRGASVNVWDAELEIDANRKVAITKRTAVRASQFPLVRIGAMSFRLLDAAGVSLYQSSIPGTNDSNSETLNAAGLPVATIARPQRLHVPITVPALAAARVIQILDEHGQEVGRQTL